MTSLARPAGTLPSAAGAFVIGMIAAPIAALTLLLGLEALLDLFSLVPSAA